MQLFKTCIKKIHFPALLQLPAGAGCLSPYSKFPSQTQKRSPPPPWSLSPASRQTALMQPSVRNRNKTLTCHRYNLPIIKKCGRDHTSSADSWRLLDKVATLEWPPVFFHVLSYMNMKHARLRQDSYHLVGGECRDKCHRKAEMSILTLYHAVFSLWLSRKGSCKGGVEVMDYHHSRGSKFCEEAILTLCCNFLPIWECKSLQICGWSVLTCLSLPFTVSSS